MGWVIATGYSTVTPGMSNIRQVGSVPCESISIPATLQALKCGLSDPVPSTFLSSIPPTTTTRFLHTLPDRFWCFTPWRLVFLRRRTAEMALPARTALRSLLGCSAGSSQRLRERRPLCSVSATFHATLAANVTFHGMAWGSTCSTRCGGQSVA